MNQAANELCRVYEAQVGDRGGYRAKIMVCDRDELRFREDIMLGRLIYRVGRVVLETPDRELARRTASIHYA